MTYLRRNSSLAIVLLLPFVACLLIPVPLLAQQPQQGSTITVTGSALRRVECDMVEATLIISGEGATVLEAKASHDGRARAVLAVLDDLGFPQESYRTNRLTITKWDPYGYLRTEEPRVPSFRANQELSVRLMDLDAWEFLLSSLLDAGASGIDNINFSYSRVDSLNAVLRREAVADATRRAEQIASALGARITGVASATDEEDAWLRHRVDVTASRRDAFEMLQMNTFQVPSPTTAPGTTDIDVRVTVAFRLASGG